MWDLIVSVPDHCLSFYFRQEYTHFPIGFLRVTRRSYSAANSRVGEKFRTQHYMCKGMFVDYDPVKEQKKNF